MPTLLANEFAPVTSKELVSSDEEQITAQPWNNLCLTHNRQSL